MAEKPRRGRPPIADPLGRPEGIRYTESERELVKSAAATAGLTLSAWVRQETVAAAQALLDRDDLRQP